MTSSDLASLLAIASEQGRDRPSSRVIRKLKENVSDSAKDLADAMESGSTDALSKDQREYLQVIVELAEG